MRDTADEMLNSNKFLKNIMADRYPTMVGNFDCMGVSSITGLSSEEGITVAFSDAYNPEVFSMELTRPEAKELLNMLYDEQSFVSEDNTAESGTQPQDGV